MYSRIFYSGITTGLIPLVADDGPRVFGAKRPLKVTLVRVNKAHGKTSGIRSRIF